MSIPTLQQVNTSLLNMPLPYPNPTVDKNITSGQKHQRISSKLNRYGDENANLNINNPYFHYDSHPQPRTKTISKAIDQNRVFGKVLNPSQFQRLSNAPNNSNTKSSQPISHNILLKSNQPKQIIESNIHLPDNYNSLQERLEHNPTPHFNLNKFQCRDQKDLHELHPELDESTRCILVDWLLEVSTKHAFKLETYFSTIQLLDIYCRLAYQQRCFIPRLSFQRIGISCLRIAAKLEETYTPPIAGFVELCDNAYSLDQLVKTEIDICLKTNFDFAFPTPYTFYLRYSAILSHSPSKIQHAIWILQVCCMPYNLSAIYIQPSLLACTSAFIVEEISESEWDTRILSLNNIQEFHKSIEWQSFLPQLLKIVDYFRHSEGPFKGIRQKYSTIIP